jgi:hypothetical protein
MTHEIGSLPAEDIRLLAAFPAKYNSSNDTLWAHWREKCVQYSDEWHEEINSALCNIPLDSNEIHRVCVELKALFSGFLDGASESDRKALNSLFDSSLSKLYGATSQGPLATHHTSRIIALSLLKADANIAFRQRDPPFVTAAKRGLVLIVQDMVGELKHMRLKPKQHRERLRVRDSGDSTAMLHAIKNGHQEVVQLLMDEDRSLGEDSWMILRCVQDSDNINRTLECLGDIFRSSKRPSREFLEGLIQANERSISVSQNFLDVLKMLVRGVQKISLSTATSIIQGPDNSSVWSTCKRLCNPLFSEPGCPLLHAAVLNQRVDIVNDIVQTHPSQVASMV